MASKNTKNKHDIRFATRLRGFFRDLFNSQFIDYKIITPPQSRMYEVSGKTHNLKSRLARSFIADWLGMVQQVGVNAGGNEIVGSFNRFVATGQPYFIYVENPTALYHYTLQRNKTWLGRKRIKKLLGQDSLRGLVYMCMACEDTFEPLVGKTKEKVVKTQIYPLVKPNPLVTGTTLESSGTKPGLHFLYIAQGVRFTSKGGLEVIEAFKKISREFPDTRLTMVTNLGMLKPGLLESVKEYGNLGILDFKLSKDEMQRLYASGDVLLQPTSDDSCSLTILEALHSGMAIIASKLYSIPEIVEDGQNGFLVEPQWWFFRKEDNMPNPEVWNHRKKTISSGHVSATLVAELETKMRRLITDRDLLVKMRKKSFEKSSSPPFSEEYIATQWNEFLGKIENNWNWNKN